MKSLTFPGPEDTGLLQAVWRMAKKKKVRIYLVGGFLRDILLKRRKENPDIDFCLKEGAIRFTRSLAKQMKAGFVILDEPHGCARAVKRKKDKVYTLDFTDFRGENIEDDLLHRDFTINAFCVALDRLLPFYSNGRLRLAHNRLEDLLIDPCNGRRDLESKTIRMVSKEAFDEDPLRLLRAFSLASIFCFKINKDTLRAIKLKAKGLSRASGERIRDELFKVLERPGAFNYLLKMDELNMLKIIMPEIEIMRGIAQGPYHHLDVWQHTLETVRQLEFLIEELKNNKAIRSYLNEFISGGRRRLGLIKLAALLHDCGKPAALRREDGKIKFHGHERIGAHIAKNVSERLKLSNGELDSLKKIILWHLRPGYLADNAEITPRAIFRYFRDTAQEGLSILLSSLADQRATRGPLTSRASRLRHEAAVSGLIKEYFRRKKEKKIKRVVTGHDLMKRLTLRPSPLIGKLLSEIEELQAIGKVKTKKQALTAARNFVLNYHRLRQSG